MTASIRATFSLIAALVFTSSIAVAQQQASVEDRLKGFDAYMEQVMKDWNAPGIGIGIVPNDGIGVIVLVIGDHVASLYNGLTYDIYERLLGLSLTPWSERYNEVRLKNKAAGTKARAVADVGRLPDTKPSHPLDDYVGEFVHPAYGVVTVRGDKELSFDFHGIKLPLSHFHYDRFDTPDDEEDGKFSLNFRTNPMGEIDSVEISMDEAAVTFNRRVPAELSSDTMLQMYAGTYTSPSGGKTVLTFQPGKGLAIRGVPDLQHSSLCLCVSVVNDSLAKTNHRDTEAQRNPFVTDFLRQGMQRLLHAYERHVAHS